jgi:hypothetical protein
MSTPHDRETGEIVRENAGGREIQRVPETAAAAMQARETAEIQAAYVVARQNPRSWADVRVRLLRDCDRIGFAEEAVYAKPQRMHHEGPDAVVKTRAGMRKVVDDEWYDGFLEGLSIRFAEDALRTSGNMRASSLAVYDDEEKRIYRVAVLDLETNAIMDDSVVVGKTIERSKSKTNKRTILYERENTAGEAVFVCEATEEEVRQKSLAGVARTRRNLILTMIPADILAECFTRCQATMAKAVKEDPEAEAKRIFDAFAQRKVLPSDLEEYLGHPIEQVTPAELVTLRGLLTALRESIASWPELLEEKTSTPEGKERPKATQGMKLAEEIRKRNEAAKAAEDAKKAPPPAGEKAEGPSPKPSQGAEPATSAGTPKAKASEAPPAQGPHMHRGEPTDGPPPDDRPKGKR